MGDDERYIHPNFKVETTAQGMFAIYTELTSDGEKLHRVRLQYETEVQAQMQALREGRNPEEEIGEV